jgi:hypothetical protein
MQTQPNSRQGLGIPPRSLRDGASCLGFCERSTEVKQLIGVDLGGTRLHAVRIDTAGHIFIASLLRVPCHPTAMCLFNTLNLEIRQASSEPLHCSSRL